MEINICHIYHDLLNVYGDRGNILILKKILEANLIKCNIDYISINDKFDENLYDFVFMGGGQDSEQVICGEDLIKNKCASLKKYIESGGCGLYICGAYQLLGEKYVAADGTNIKGASILDIRTEKGEDRFLGDIIINSKVLDATLVGFENHSGRTFFDNYTPLGYTIYGKGNNGKDTKEGLIHKNTICTYMHGSALSKNPELINYIIKNVLFKKYNFNININFNYSSFYDARSTIIKKYKKVQL